MPSRSFELSLAGAKWSGTFLSLELSFSRVFAPRNIRPLELSFPVSPWHWFTTSFGAWSPARFFSTGGQWGRCEEAKSPSGVQEQLPGQGLEADGNFSKWCINTVALDICSTKITLQHFWEGGKCPSCPCLRAAMVRGVICAGSGNNVCNDGNRLLMMMIMTMMCIQG